MRPGTLVRDNHGIYGIVVSIEEFAEYKRKILARLDHNINWNEKTPVIWSYELKKEYQM